MGLRPVKGREKNASSDNIGYHKSGIIPDGGTLIKCYNIYDSLGTRFRSNSSVFSLEQFSVSVDLKKMNHLILS